MLNITHFTYLAGNPAAWNAEMARRVMAGEALTDLQEEFHGRGRREIKIVRTMRAFSVRHATGLSCFGLVFKDCPTYEDAVQKGTGWVKIDPKNRALYVRNTDIPKGGN